MNGRKFVQINELTGKGVETKGLAHKAYKEQNSARPMRAEAGSGITELGRKVREKVKDEETLVTKFPKWEETVASRQPLAHICQHPANVGHGICGPTATQEKNALDSSLGI